MTIITLTTDFGIDDHEAGVLKGVIWSIAPETQVVDLTHDIAPHNIMGAALVLWRSVPYFPNGTIHVGIVDPGVGTSRRGIAAQIASQYFVGPDNGLLTLLVNRSQGNYEHIKFVSLDQSRYWLTDVSNVFHARDIFAPIAAHLASGIPIEAIGTAINDPVMLEISAPTRSPQGWKGQIIDVDHFGNLTTNLTGTHLLPMKEVMINIKGKQIVGLVSTFGERPVGSLVALIDSSGSLAISVVNGSAEKILNAQVGDTLDIISIGSA